MKSINVQNWESLETIGDLRKAFLNMKCPFTLKVKTESEGQIWVDIFLKQYRCSYGVHVEGDLTVYEIKKRKGEYVEWWE